MSEGARGGARPLEEIFERRTAIVLALVAAVSLVATLVVSALAGEVGGEQSAGADAFSRSALGYHALVRFLEASGVTVELSRHDSAAKVGPGKALFIAAPAAPRRDAVLIESESESEDDEDETPSLRAMVGAAHDEDAAVLVVLPKWEGTPKLGRSGWIERAALVPEADARAALASALGGDLPDDAIARLPSPAIFTTSLAGGLLPALAQPQLVRLGIERIEPIVWSAEGILIGRDRDADTIIVADPDLFNTAGLGRGDNAAIAHALVTRHLGASSLVVDETLHGFGRVPSLWAELFRFPLVLCTLHFAGLFAALVWAAMGRFGKPEPLAPRLASGKLSLVESTAELVAGGGVAAHSLERYFQVILRAGAAACALAPGLDERETIARLRALGEARGVTLDIGALGEAARSFAGKKGQKGAAAMLAVARDLYRWRQEIEGGDR